MDFAQYATDAIGSQISNIAYGAAHGAGLHVLNKMVKQYKKKPVTTTTELAKANAYKIQRLSKQVRLNTGELHCLSNNSGYSLPALFLQGIELTAIGTGDDLSHRSGRSVRIRGVNIRIYTAVPDDIDAYLIRAPHGTGFPAITDFAGTRGGHLLDVVKDDYKEIHYFKSYGASDSKFNKYNRRFNFIVKYNGATSGTGVQNRLYLILINRNTSATANVEVSWKCYFNVD